MYRPSHPQRLQPHAAFAVHTVRSSDLALLLALLIGSAVWCLLSYPRPPSLPPLELPPPCSLPPLPPHPHPQPPPPPSQPPPLRLPTSTGCTPLLAAPPLAPPRVMSPPVSQWSGVRGQSLVIHFEMSSMGSTSSAFSSSPWKGGAPLPASMPTSASG
ncbi:hypothetical protein INR49_021949 [Caranx melampygus]|nr:hypothetical protein INR49_021949 [Caranx melampygus]